MARIMVVDDLPLMRLRIREALVEAGHEVIEATEGREAVEKYESARPDAVLLDIGMPGMDGTEALKQIRTIDPGARVTMLTGDAPRQMVEQARESGAADFMLKPFTNQRLLAAVDSMLR